MYIIVSQDNCTLTPFAKEHLEYIKVEANMYTVDLIKDDEYTVWRKQENNAPHIVNWSSRSCSNCHLYAETLLPCFHIYAIWIHHKTGGVLTKNSFGEWRKISHREEAIEHLFGKCYLISTLKTIVDNVSNVRPVSLESISLDENCPKITLQKQTCRGRPQIKRLASSCDSFLTGNVQKYNKKLNADVPLINVFENPI